MKKTLQTKRRKAAKSGFKTLYAKTNRSRKMKASTSADAHADLESDIPNVGIGRALLVILLLHVVAIAAIYTHFALFNEEQEASSAQKESKVAVTGAKPVASAPPIVQNQVPASVIPAAAVSSSADNNLSERYIVVTGDTYTRIAQVRNVDLTALRALNYNRALRAGIVLDLPAELSSRPVNVHRVRSESDVEAAPVSRTGSRAIEVSEPAAQQAVVVKPRINRSAAVQAASAVSYSGQSYTVQSGDTLWRISKRYGVSRDKLLRLNGIKDATKLQIGAELKIPTQ